MSNVTKKPKARVLGEDGNVFNLISICSSALKKANQSEKIKGMCDKVFDAKSYEESLRILSEYCELV